MSEKTSSNDPQQHPSREVHLGEGGAKGMVVINASPVNVVPSPKPKTTGDPSAPKK